AEGVADAARVAEVSDAAKVAEVSDAAKVANVSDAAEVVEERSWLVSKPGVVEPMPTELQLEMSNPFADLNDEEIDLAFEHAEIPNIKGGKTPTVAGHRVPARRLRRLDIQDLSVRAGETQ